MTKDEFSGTKAYFTQMTMHVGILSVLQAFECFQLVQRFLAILVEQRKY